MAEKKFSKAEALRFLKKKGLDKEFIRYSKVRRGNYVERERFGSGVFVVARGRNGRVLSRRKWSRSFNLTKARAKFRSDRTFKDGTKIINRTTVREVKEYSRNSRKPSVRKKFGRVQYFVEGYAKVGKKGVFVSARSEQVDVEVADVPYLRGQAMTSWFERVAQALGLKYDEELGMEQELFGNARITGEGLIHYEELR